MLDTLTQSISLRRRLLLWLMGASLLAWGAASLLSYRGARHEIDEVLDAHLAQSAALLMAQLAHEPEEIDTEHVPVLHRHGRYVVFQVWDAAGQLHLHSANAPDVPLCPPRGGYADCFTDGTHWRVFSAWNEDRSLLVQVGEDAGVRAEAARKVAAGLLPPLLIALPVLALLILWGVRQGLKPLAGLRQEVERRDPANLEALAKPVPAEVAPLVAALNTLFARMRALLENERRFTADAAHELRTPLAAIRTQAQVARAAAAEAERLHALDQVLAGCDRAAHLVEQLLLLARLEAGPPPSATLCSLRELAAQAIADVAPVAIRKGVELELEDGPEMMVRGAPEWLRILMRNLIDNAVRYSPPGSTVQVRVAKHADAAVFSVTDEGPGIPQAQRVAVWQRFHRVLGSGEAGSGLGLSIVRRIAELHGAQAWIEDGEAGRGLRVGVQFSAVSP
ncbi:ATP-binding protein [Thiobacter aerophilum]|uniref:histidine kinase n=1 Tax=Thiobacter aerophilum TaxID=3121275 RepID=A0ABV0EG67_9BURK